MATITTKKYKLKGQQPFSKREKEDVQKILMSQYTKGFILEKSLDENLDGYIIIKLVTCAS